MAYKRPAEDSAELPPQKRAKSGFNVGQNLPDGAHKRKADKIRRKLVENAKIKKSYDKIKAREAHGIDGTDSFLISDQPAPITRHPDRQALIEDKSTNHDVAKDNENLGTRGGDVTEARPSRRRRQQLYLQEKRVAGDRAHELDRRREAVAAAREERDKRIAQRERWRRTLTNARGDGKRRKLGKESTVLLEKIKRVIGDEQTRN